MIKGIGDGTYDIDTACAVGRLKGIYPEFYGEVTLKGKLKILGKRYTIDAQVSSMAKLLCDVSLEDYNEEISADISVAYLANTDLYYARQDEDNEDFETEIVIHEDDKFIDLTEEVTQQLNVSLPMKRVAPKYRDKELEEIYPEFTDSSDKDNTENKDQNEDIDERWSALKKLKLN
jgi:uncharacterized metal-binding protein YceD (DUF177 family)